MMYAVTLFKQTEKAKAKNAKSQIRQIKNMETFGIRSIFIHSNSLFIQEKSK